MLVSFLTGKFLLHILCCLHLYLRSFSYTSRSAFIVIWGVSLTHPVLASFLYLGSFSIHRVLLSFFIRGVSLTYPVLVYLFIYYQGNFSYTSRAAFIFYLGSFYYTYQAAFIFIWGISLTHPMLASFMRGVSLTHPELTFLCEEFLLHIQCWLLFFSFLCEELFLCGLL